MAKRKPDPSLAGQLDMFAGIEVPFNPNKASMTPANDAWIDPRGAARQDIDVQVQNRVAPTEIPKPASSHDKAHALALADEWWTLAMVCAFLKVGRKAIWERKRDPLIGFPKSVCHGSSRPRWRSCDVRHWADQRVTDLDRKETRDQIV